MPVITCTYILFWCISSGHSYNEILCKLGMSIFGILISYVMVADQAEKLID